MDREGGGSAAGSCYYSVLGIRKDASISDIRSAYRSLAMKWHPDRYARNPGVSGEAKRRFQQIQEAYSVLSEESTPAPTIRWRKKTKSLQNISPF